MQMGRNPIRLNGASPYGGSNALGIAAIDGQNYTAVKHETVRAAQRWPSDCASALTGAAAQVNSAGTQLLGAIPAVKRAASIALPWVGGIGSSCSGRVRIAVTAGEPEVWW